MLKLVAFDLDGTIANTIPMCLDAFREAVSPYAGHTLSDEEIIQTFGMNEIGMVKAVISDHCEEALLDFYARYEAYHDRCGTPFREVIPLINMLKKKGLIVAMVTGKGTTSCEITLRKFKMNEMFSDVMTGSEEDNNKDLSLKKLMDKYNLKPEECVYIGDAISDVTAANRVGVTCLSAAWTDTAAKERLEEINKGNVFYSIAQIREYFEKMV